MNRFQLWVWTTFWTINHMPWHKLVPLSLVWAFIAGLLIWTVIVCLQALSQLMMVGG